MNSGGTGYTPSLGIITYEFSESYLAQIPKRVHAEGDVITIVGDPSTIGGISSDYVTLQVTGEDEEDRVFLYLIVYKKFRTNLHYFSIWF